MGGQLRFVELLWLGGEGAGVTKGNHVFFDISRVHACVSQSRVVVFVSYPHSKTVDTLMFRPIRRPFRTFFRPRIPKNVVFESKSQISQEIVVSRSKNGGSRTQAEKRSQNDVFTIKLAIQNGGPKFSENRTSRSAPPGRSDFRRILGFCCVEDG